MAAYAALVSLMHIIEQIQHHPRPPISLEKNQVESLTENVTFLQDFLEGYNFHGGNEEADGLLSRIADAAYAAEDIIESHVVDQILARSTSITHGEKMSPIDFYQGLQKVIEDMDFIKKEVMGIQEKTGTQDQLHGNSSPDVSQRSPSAGQNTMVGFDDVLIQLMDKLTGQQASRQIIPIVGMGGIGKTTLARNVYSKPLIVQHFDRRAWVTISQEYSVREILVELLCQISPAKRETLSEKNEKDIGVQLHKTLSGRRYLIIIDDIWSIEAWDKVKFFFPDNNNESRIMITTRLSKVALDISGTSGLDMNFLDEEKSWNLFCKIVFGEESCPLELEKIGKEIAKNCKGLPLSIVVIGGLLAKSKPTREYWKYTAENLNSIVNLEDNECCLKILHTSYNQLPVHLKPCFLYMGVFPEDTVIRSSNLIRLWVAERFLKPINDKSLEEIAEECLKNLIDRNLILVHERGISEKIKSCKIHDLVRDLCLREAEGENFLCVRKEHNLNIPQGGMKTQRRIALHRSTKLDGEHLNLVFDAVKSASLARSLIYDFGGVLPYLNSRLLRILRAVDEEKCRLKAIFQLVNLRHLEMDSFSYQGFRFPSSACLLWNLHTLIVRGTEAAIVAPVEIWKMPQLRHVEFNALYLLDPPLCSELERGDDCVLENLRTLLNIIDFKFSKNVVKKIPNIKKLGISYLKFKEESGSHYALNNLGHLHKLESLDCFFSIEEKVCLRNDLLKNLSFPHSLKKLTLTGSRLRWEDMATKIGPLPLLQVLRVEGDAFIGSKWETVEGQFRNLKVLEIGTFIDLEEWITDKNHFPRLERLVLAGLDKLKEIPWGIGEIPTLQSIELRNCCDSAVIFAKELQKELGDVDWKVQVKTRSSQKKLMKSLASDNFLVELW